jgi:hypothetical protein
MSSLDNRVDGIYQTLAVQGHSPLSLTARGEEIVSMKSENVPKF